MRIKIQINRSPDEYPHIYYGDGSAEGIPSTDRFYVYPLGLVKVCERWDDGIKATEGETYHTETINSATREAVEAWVDRFFGEDNVDTITWEDDEDTAPVAQCQICGCTLDISGLDESQKYVCEDCRTRNPHHQPDLATAALA